MSENTNPSVRIFAVDTRFQKMARRSGGVPREVAIERAQEQIETFKDEFVDFVDRELQELTEAFRSIASDTITEAQLDELEQRCSQLRDTGTTMGLALITFVADNLCQVLNTVRNGARYEPATIDCHIDALTLATTEPYRNLKPDQLPEMTEGLYRVLERANRQVMHPAMDKTSSDA
jgi:chemotaxis protein histidine kinase CheA